MCLAEGRTSSRISESTSRGVPSGVPRGVPSSVPSHWAIGFPIRFWAVVGKPSVPVNLPLKAKGKTRMASSRRRFWSHVLADAFGSESTARLIVQTGRLDLDFNKLLDEARKERLAAMPDDDALAEAQRQKRAAVNARKRFRFWAEHARTHKRQSRIEVFHVYAPLLCVRACSAFQVQPQLGSAEWGRRACADVPAAQCLDEVPLRPAPRRLRRGEGRRRVRLARAWLAEVLAVQPLPLFLVQAGVGGARSKLRDATALCNLVVRIRILGSIQYLVEVYFKLLQPPVRVPRGASELCHDTQIFLQHLCQRTRPLRPLRRPLRPLRPSGV